MFGWLKSKAKERLSKEADKAIFQCENFIGFAWDWVGESSDHALVEIQDKLTELYEKLNQIKKTRKNDGTFSYVDADKLMKLNKDCRRIYSRFNVAKSFDDEFKFIVEKKDTEKDPYSLKMREELLSEKSLLRQMKKKFKERDQLKQNQQPNKKDKPLSKQEMEEAMRMGSKLADLGTLHNLESRTKASLEKDIDKDNPYSTERRKDFLSEKSLADRMSKTLGELAKKNRK